MWDTLLLSVLIVNLVVDGVIGTRPAGTSANIAWVPCSGLNSTTAGGCFKRIAPSLSGRMVSSCSLGLRTISLIMPQASCSVRNRRYLPLSKCFIKLRQSVLCMNNVFPISCGAAMFCQGGLIPSLGGNIAILVSEDQFAGYLFLAYRNIAPPIMYLVY